MEMFNSIASDVFKTPGNNVIDEGNVSSVGLGLVS